MAEITLDVTDGVALVTVSNPEVKNGLTTAMGRRLVEICEEIDRRPEIGAAVIRGAEGTFCSGADTRTWDPAVAQSSEEGFSAASAVYESFPRFGELAVPTVAALRGATVGGGLNLAFAADLRIVAEDARLIPGFTRIGIHPGGGFITLLGRLAGREATAAAALFGTELSGADAVRLGIAWEALPDAEVEPRALALAAIAARDPELSRHTVASFRRELGPPPVPWRVALEMERGTQMWSIDRMQKRRAEASRA